MTLVKWDDKSVRLVIGISESAISDEECFWPMVNIGEKMFSVVSLKEECDDNQKMLRHLNEIEYRAASLLFQAAPQILRYNEEANLSRLIAAIHVPGNAD